MKYFTDALFLFSTFFISHIKLELKFFKFGNGLVFFCCWIVYLSYDDIYASEKFVLHFFKIFCDLLHIFTAF